MTYICIFNTFCILLLGFILFLVLRQVGFISNQFPQMGARNDGSGPRIGEDISNQISDYDAFVLLPQSGGVIIIFVSMSCSVCKFVVDAARNLHKEWKSEYRFVLVFNENVDQLEIIKKFGDISWAAFVISPELRDQLGVVLVPYAVSIDSYGLVKGSGLVNNISNLESLLE